MTYPLGHMPELAIPEHAITITDGKSARTVKIWHDPEFRRCGAFYLAGASVPTWRGRFVGPHQRAYKVRDFLFPSSETA